MSRVMRKPVFCICENKDADQLRSAFVFTTRIVQSLYFLNPKFQASSHHCGCTARFVWDLVGNPEDRFSHNETHIIRALVEWLEEEEQQQELHRHHHHHQQQSRDDVDKNFFWYYLSLVVRNPVFGVFDLVPHKPGCTAIEDG